jgi:hypothetical protein
MWRKERTKILNRIALVMGTMGFMLMMWIAVSTIDVAAHNFNDSEHIGQWNLFKYSQSVR